MTLAKYEIFAVFLVRCIIRHLSDRFIRILHYDAWTARTIPHVGQWTIIVPHASLLPISIEYGIDRNT